LVVADIPHRGVAVPSGLKPGDRGKYLAVEAGAALVELLVHGGHVFLESQRAQTATEFNREKTRQEIELLDAQTQGEIRKLEAQLGSVREKTTRLRMVLDLIATQGTSLPAVYAQSLSKAVENLTKEF
jgi:hypothetical protein